MVYRIEKLNQITRGWTNYSQNWKYEEKLIKIDGYLRTRMKVVIWKQQKKGGKRKTVL